ncbi:hypothetical protein LguiA_006053 [Lonicera macranthoides]
MTKDNPMTASERQRRLKKNVGTGSKKQYGIKRKPLTPPSSESTEAESESMSQTNPPTQENPDGTLTQTQTEIPAEENPSGGENQNEEVEESHDGIAADGDNDGGPVDKSILTSFSDHIAYAIWNRHEHIVVDEALVLLDKALLGGKEEDIPIAARKVRDMIFDAKNEMTQNKGQERRTKNMHDHIATPSCSVRPQAKKKGPTKGKGPAKKKAKK